MFIIQEGKKKFDKQTTKFCQSLEKYLNLKTKGNDGALREVSAFSSVLYQRLHRFPWVHLIVESVLWCPSETRLVC